MKSRLATLQQLLPRLPEKMLAACSGGGGIPDPMNPQAQTPPGATAATTKLPTVDEAWDLPIPAELTQRQVQLMLQEANRSQCSAFTGSGAQWAALLEEQDRAKEKESEATKTIKIEEGSCEAANGKSNLYFPPPPVRPACVGIRS